MGSGEAWMEELTVRMAGSGDIIGDPCCELEALEDALMADAGAASGPCAWKSVWTFGRWVLLDREGMVLPEPNAWGVEERVESVLLLIMIEMVCR